MYLQIRFGIKLNGFYRDCRVIGSPEQNSRLLLVAAAEKVMRQGFDLLGIVTLDKIWSVCWVKCD